MMRLHTDSKSMTYSINCLILCKAQGRYCPKLQASSINDGGSRARFGIRATTVVGWWGQSLTVYMACISHFA